MADSIPDFLKIIFIPESLKPGEKGKLEIEFDSAKAGKYGHFRYDLKFLINTVLIKLPFQINAYIQPDFSGLSEEELKTAQKIKLPSKVFNIGKLERFIDKEVVVDFQNIGEKDLTILDVAIARSIEVLDYTKVVKPGTKGTVALRIKEKSNTPNFNRVIKILSDDPSSFETPVTIKGVLVTTTEEVVPALTAKKLYEMIQEYNKTRADIFIGKDIAFKDLVIFDVRSKELYDKYHIEGALNVQVGTVEFKKIINTLEKDWVYCFYSDNDLDSSKAAKHLSNTGIKQVYYLKKGIKDWMKHKYPMADKK